MKELKISMFIKKSSPMNVILTGRYIEKQYNELFKEKGLTLFSALVLVSIFFEDTKSIRPSTLYDILPITKGNISHITSSLESYSLIQRFNRIGDNRGFEFRLTTKGEKLAIEVIKIFNNQEDFFDEKIKYFSNDNLIQMLETIK